ncbi:hypothetical protein [Brevibacterium moorei]|uniref:hypothetical protein n=1 Tax=Brevibacterium moorei TaxID=2968457 RepID=UPI00211B7D5F|nr:hypothetical protein [Brevibacterium sp. 68QC2CO]MCQ9385103.1 hypothetical protein [Brevibacterium sp. 68QC2CO]
MTAVEYDEDDFNVDKAIGYACHLAHADQCDTAEAEDIGQMVWVKYLESGWHRYPVGKQIYLIRREAREAMRREADDYRRFSGGYSNTPRTVGIVLASAEWAVIDGEPRLCESERFDKAFLDCTKRQRRALFKRYTEGSEDMTHAEELAASAGREHMSYVLDLPSFGRVEDAMVYEVVTTIKEAA